MAQWTEIDTHTGQARPVQIPDELAQALNAELDRINATREGQCDDPDNTMTDRSYPDVGHFVD